MVQLSQRGVPAWVRVYLVVGAAQGLAIAITGLARPAHVVGFPLATTPLNVRFVACFYLAGATGLFASAAALRAVITRLSLAAFSAVTALPRWMIAINSASLISARLSDFTSTCLGMIEAMTRR